MINSLASIINAVKSIFPYLVKPVRNSLSPLSFNVHVKIKNDRTATESEWAQTFSISNKQENSNSTLSVRIEPITRFRWLYNERKVRIVANLIDKNGKIAIHAGHILKPGITRINEYELNPNIGNRTVFSIAKRGSEEIINYPLSIQIIADCIKSEHTIICNPKL